MDYLQSLLPSPSLIPLKPSLSDLNITLVVLGILLEEPKFLGSKFIFFPRWVTINDIKLSKGSKIIVFNISLDVDWWMVTFLRPAILLLHEQRHSWILNVSNCRVNILDKVLRTLTCLYVLSIEAIVLCRVFYTYFRMRLSVVE